MKFTAVDMILSLAMRNLLRIQEIVITIPYLVKFLLHESLVEKSALFSFQDCHFSYLLHLVYGSNL